jgi:hypothetical protein
VKQQGTPFSGLVRQFSYDSVVSPEEAVVALTAVAAQAGVEVRIERFELALAGKGGLCRLEGRRLILVDAKLGVLEQAGVIGEALGGVDLGSVQLPSDVGAYVRTGHAEVRSLRQLRPLRMVRRAP